MYHFLVLPILNEIKVFNFQYHKGIIKLELKFMVMILLSSFFYFVESAAALNEC